MIRKLGLMEGESMFGLEIVFNPNGHQFSI